jgi:hypothetical protein
MCLCPNGLFSEETQRQSYERLCKLLCSTSCIAVPGIAGTIAKTESSAATVDDNGVLGIAESSSGIGACQPSFAD